MTPEDETECRRVVFGYATALNEWEIQKYIFDRIQEGRHVAPTRMALVTGLTNESLVKRHTELFAAYIYPRDRKYGTNPGGPMVIGRDGRFFDVKEETITSVAERSRNTVEVITGWGYMLPGGQTMFVLKRRSGRWLIDSLKTKSYDADWVNSLI
jgi:hypothetical protein